MLQKVHSYPFIRDGPQEGNRAKSKKIKVPQGAFHIQSIWKPMTLDEKPPYSYATIIAHAILSSPEHKLTLNKMYQWISEQYPCYSIKDNRWQNSVRHNLSLKKAFVKLNRSTKGKGCYWAISPGYEQQFIDNLMKHDKSITNDTEKRPSHLYTIFRMTTQPALQPDPIMQDNDSDCDSGIDINTNLDEQDFMLFNTYMDLLTQPLLYDPFNTQNLFF